MDPSLSVVLPVHNAESVLAEQVAELLEVLSDITSQFEILIVDDGSSDQTEEVAYELSRHYPQLQVAHHDRKRGTEASMQTGMKRAHGDVVMVHEENATIRASEIRRLWEMRFDEGLLMARAETTARPLSSELLDRLGRWGSQLRKTASSGAGGIQMIRREAVEQLDASNTRKYSVRFCRTPRRPAHLTRPDDAASPATGQSDSLPQGDPS